MPLSLYRRHRLECEAKALHPEDSRTYEADEKRKGYKGRCHCEIHVGGTLTGKRIRKTTGKTVWDEARVVAAAIETGNARPLTPEPPVSPTASRTTIPDAIKVYLSNREAANLAPASLRKYGVFTRKLQKFADGRGYVMLDQFTTADIDIFYSTSKLGIRSKAKLLEKLRTFWRFCVNRELVAKSPVSVDLKPPIGANRIVNKEPFSDAQLEAIIKACDRMNQRKWKNGHGAGVAMPDTSEKKWGNRHGAGHWTGEDLKDFVWLSVYTGFRISDVVLFDMARLQGNNVFLRAKKNGGEVFAWLNDDLRDRLLTRAERYGKQPFMVGGSKRLDTVIDAWRQQLAKVFKLAEIGTGCTPHRLRHTYARILLEKGISVSDVAELMGDTEQVIRTHYFRWCLEKQERLTAVQQHAFSDRPKLAVISRGRAK
jgi:integrase